MDTTAIAISLGIPCLFMSIMFAYIAYKCEVNTDSNKALKALNDERIADRLVLACLSIRIKQCKAQIVQESIKISQHRVAIAAGRRAVIEHRLIIAALNDLGRASWRKRKRASTLPYHRPITQS